MAESKTNNKIKYDIVTVYVLAYIDTHDFTINLIHERQDNTPLALFLTFLVYVDRLVRLDSF